MVNPTPQTNRFYGKGLPGIDPASLHGRLIVVEGADGSGRSTQIEMLKDWLEQHGQPTVVVGLKRSSLVGRELARAMEGNTLSPVTLSLFYATDFADQLENEIVPALQAGFLVLADRYIYTLMARQIVRGMRPEWVRDVYSFAVIPDRVIYLSVRPTTLAERNFRKNTILDYWESGMDIQRSGDIYECFIRYQKQMRNAFQKLQAEYRFDTVNGDRHPWVIFKDLRARLEALLPP